MAPSWESRFRGAVAGIIEAAASVRASSAQLWAEIRPTLADAGIPIGRDGFRLVSRMWSDAAARRRSAERFQAVDPLAAFDRSMAAVGMNPRSEVLRDMMPEYRVTFDLTYLDPSGDEVTRTVSMRDVWRPGMTVGDVHDAVAEAAEGLSNDYGQGMVGYANLRPVTI